MKSDDKKFDELLNSWTSDKEIENVTFTDEQLKSLNEQLLAYDMRELLSKGRIEFPNGDVMVLKTYKKRKIFKKMAQLFAYAKTFLS